MNIFRQAIDWKKQFLPDKVMKAVIFVFIHIWLKTLHVLNLIYSLKQKMQLRIRHFLAQNCFMYLFILLAIMDIVWFESDCEVNL